jgi:hypothetical protein
MNPLLPKRLMRRIEAIEASAVHARADVKRLMSGLPVEAICRATTPEELEMIIAALQEPDGAKRLVEKYPDLDRRCKERLDHISMALFQKPYDQVQQAFAQVEAYSAAHGLAGPPPSPPLMAEPIKRF